MMACRARFGGAAVESTCPPTPEKNFEPMESAQPGRSGLSPGGIDRDHLVLWRMTDGSLTYSVGWKEKSGLLSM